MSDADPSRAFLTGGGTMGARMRAFDWAATSLGAPDTWHSSLKAAIRVMLTSRFAMWMAAGPELIFFCNDAYLPTTGNKSDWVLGERSDKVWSEIWPDIGPRIESVLATGEATWDEGLLLYLERRGFAEETYHTFSYSPLDDGSGLTAGMLCVVAEVTEKVIGERQLAMLRDLGSRLAGAATRLEVMRALEASLALEPRDLPFALAYYVDGGAHEGTLAAVHGLQRQSALAAPRVQVRGHDVVWPAGTGLAGCPSVVALPEVDFDIAAPRFWQNLPQLAYVLPLSRNENDTPFGFLIAGLNPHRVFDEAYRGFIELVAAQLAAAVARADDYDRERARAQALAEIDRAKTAFFSNVSHEFRTPLTLMLGPLEDALADATLPGAHAERVRLAHRNGLRLLRLVNGLLNFSRIEAGRVQATYRPTDLAAFTAELASTFRSACERAGLAFVVDCPPLGEPVYIDTDMWETIVLNLLSNAFKFTLAGQIAVRVRAAAGMAELEVRDTGSGIPKGDLPRLFDRFHRVEGAVGRSFEGSGIGLALVAELVKLHGGEVAADSEEGKGSVFRVRVPLGAAHLPATQIDAGPAHDRLPGSGQSFVEEAMRWLPGEGEPGQLGIIADSAAGVIDARGCSTGAGSTGAGSRGAGSRGGGFNDGAERTLRGTVLLADDNADLREYVSGLLQSRGYEVTAVGNGGAALAAAQARRPDLILTDVMMPVMDGFALLNAIRAAPSLADVPVIMLSARAGEEAQVEGLQAGADDYLAKPFSARELLARVAANLDIARTRREAGHAIRASEARLRGVLEGMTEGFALLDANFRIIEINAQGLRMEARPKEFLLGKTHWEVYPGSQASELGLLYQRAMRDRVPVSLEHEYTWPENRRAWIDMRAYPTDDGGLAIFYRDVTDRRQALDALRHLNESLERRIAEAVAEREAVLVRLNETQRLETLGQLTGGVAHDFNNLLTPIMGALDLLRRRHEDERSQRLISGAMQSAERAKTLVGRLLAFARRQTLEPQPVDPGTLLEGLRDLISHSVGPAIEVCLDIPDHLPPALVDPSQLELALLNLAVNARDAMDSGGTLTITAAADVVAAGVVPGLAPGRYIRFQVTDTGCGMDEATLARAVEPFFTTKDIGKGTGLGLSMVHGLALQSGGTMRLTSAFGAGTTAALWLPVSSSGAVGIAKQNEDAPKAGRQAMLLLVDDEELVRATTAALMVELGYDVVEAASAAAALEKVRAGLLPDLVVTDHMMPGMTGAQLVSALREKIAGIPALIISGYANLQSEGAFDAELLTKPFTFADLAKRVAMLLTPQSGHAGAVPE